jgi:chromate reductase, NAD(P)H dehydrogenase (quinone)
MITIIIGTNRPNSKSKVVGEYYQKLLSNIGENSEILDLADLPNDFIFSALYENSGKNELFNELKSKIDNANKFVFIVPEYNGSFPGVLKAFIDGLSFPGSFIHKKAALVGISSGVQGGSIALSHLTDIFHYLGLNVLAQKVKIPFMSKNFVDGQVVDPLIKSLIEDQAKLIAKF